MQEPCPTMLKYPFLQKNMKNYELYIVGYNNKLQFSKLLRSPNNSKVIVSFVNSSF